MRPALRIAKPPAEASPWSWPLDVAGYDRTPTLTAQELAALEVLGWKVRQWPQRWRDVRQSRWRALHRLMSPLAAARDVLEVPGGDFHRRSADDAVALVLHGCAEHRRCYWAWDTPTWAEVLGVSGKAYQ